MMNFTRCGLVFCWSVVMLCLIGCKKQPPQQSVTSSSTPTAEPLQPKPTDISKSEPSSPQPVDAQKLNIDEFIKKVLSETPSAGLTNVAWRKIYEQFWRASFDEPLPTGLDEKGMIQKELADVLLRSLNTPSAHPQFSQQFVAGKFEGVTSEAEAKSLIAFYKVTSFDAFGNGHGLLYVIESLAKDAPPTRGDLLMYQLLSDAYQEMENPAPLTEVEISAWKKLAHVKNPIYRLLALRTFPLIDGSGERGVEFCREYMNESDPVIIKQAVDFVAGTSGAERLNYLNEFLKNNRTKLSDQMVSYLEEMKRYLEARLK